MVISKSFWVSICFVPFFLPQQKFPAPKKSKTDRVSSLLRNVPVRRVESSEVLLCMPGDGIFRKLIWAGQISAPTSSMENPYFQKENTKGKAHLCLCGELLSKNRDFCLGKTMPLWIRSVTNDSPVQKGKINCALCGDVIVWRIVNKNLNNPQLVGGFNPFEKYARQIGSFPQFSSIFGMKIKKYLKPPPS